jgi:hypothetical protein
MLKGRGGGRGGFKCVGVYGRGQRSVEAATPGGAMGRQGVRIRLSGGGVCIDYDNATLKPGQQGQADT